MTEEVKNCPFCSKTVLVGYLCAENVVKCSSCGANMNIRRMGGTQKAIAAWNHRPLEDAKDARIAELEKEATYWKAKCMEADFQNEHIADLERQLAEALDENKELNAANVRLGKALAEATTWRSPETAPRDKYFLALMYGRQPCVIARNAADTLWICLYSAITFEDEDGHHFTGWLPLPEPKKEDV